MESKPSRAVWVLATNNLQTVKNKKKKLLNLEEKHHLHRHFPQLWVWRAADHQQWQSMLSTGMQPRCESSRAGPGLPPSWEPLVCSSTWTTNVPGSWFHSKWLEIIVPGSLAVWWAPSKEKEVIKAGWSPTRLATESFKWGSERLLDWRTLSGATWSFCCNRRQGWKHKPEL